MLGGLRRTAESCEGNGNAGRTLSLSFFAGSLLPWKKTTATEKLSHSSITIIALNFGSQKGSRDVHTPECKRLEELSLNSSWWIHQRFAMVESRPLINPSSQHIDGRGYKGAGEQMTPEYQHQYQILQHSYIHTPISPTPWSFSSSSRHGSGPPSTIESLPLASISDVVGA